MSQLYRLQLSSSVSRTVTASDSVCYPIRLTAIQPEDEMVELLREALLRHGFEPDGEDHLLRGRGPEGEDLVVDLDAMTLTATLEEEKELVTQAAAHGTGESRREARVRAEAELDANREAAEQRLEREGKQVQRQLSRRLERSEAARNRQLHEVLQEVYAEALKRKARTLGDVTELRESTSDDGQYELVITIEQ